MQASGRRGWGSNPPKAFKLLPRQHGSEVRSHCLEARRTDRTPCISSSLCCCAVQPRGTVPQRSQKPDISGSHPGRGGAFLSARRSTSSRCHSGTKTSDRDHPPSSLPCVPSPWPQEEKKQSEAVSTVPRPRLCTFPVPIHNLL